MRAVYAKLLPAVAVAALNCSMAEAATPPAETTFQSATLSDVAGRVAGECMNQGWTVSSQSDNQVTCQVPMNFGRQLLADVFLGSRYSTSTVSYVQFNMAQIGDSVRAQGRAWLQNQSAFGQVRQTPFTDRKTQSGILAFLNRVGLAMSSETLQTPSLGIPSVPVGGPAISSDDEIQSNLRFVDRQVADGHCDVARSLAESVNETAVTAHVQTLCQGK